MAAPILYSVAMPLNRGGLGTIAWHACLGLQRAGLLQMVLAPETRAAGPLSPWARELPWFFRNGMRVLNRFQWYCLHDDFFDRWVSTWIESGMNYYGWMNQSLACIRKCHGFNGRTLIDRGSVEPRLQYRWLIEEYAKYELRHDPMHRLTIQRMVYEADESDIIVVPSRLVADSYVAAGYKSCKLFVNPLGVNIRLYESTAKHHCQDVIRFIFVGQISIQKGIPNLLRVWKKLMPSNAELILAGMIPPGEKSVIQSLLQDTPRLNWIGHCQNVSALLQTCDVLLLPSAQDGFGLVVLEAFANGLPVIVSDRVGAKDCVLDGENGFIFRFGDIQALEDRLRWFLEDGNRSRTMSAAAFKTAEHYTWESYGQRLASLCQSL